MSLVAEAAGRLRVRVDTARLRDLVSEIAWAKVSNVRPEDYARLAEQHHRSVASIDPETVARIFTGYEEAKRDRGRIDFEDILLCAAALISDHPEVADARSAGPTGTWSSTSTRTSARCRRRCSPCGAATASEICVVGDPAQTIHSFAGAQADLPDRVRPPVPRRDGGQAGPRLPLDAAGGRLRQRGHVGGRGASSLTLVGPAPAGPAGGASPRRRTRRPRRPASPTGSRRRPRPASTTARWPCCSGSTRSRRRWSRRWPSAASRTWSAAASASTSGPRCARRC